MAHCRIVRHEERPSVGATAVRPLLWRLPDRRRQTVAVLLGMVTFPVATAVLVVTRDHHSLSTTLLAYVLLVVAVTSIGGAVVGIAGAVVAFATANYYFTDPVGTFAVANSEDVLALVAFLLVAAIVSSLVHVERRRAREAQAATADADAVAHAAVVLASSTEPVPALLAHLAAAVRPRAVVLEQRADGGWRAIGPAPDDRPEARRQDETFTADGVIVAVDAAHRLVVAGDDLPAPLRRLTAAVASQLATALRSEALREATERARAQAAGDAYRTALLRAVSHDLRTPLTAIKTSVSSLRSEEVRWSDSEVAEFLEVIDTESDRLDRLIADLLDMSRLQTGGVHARLAAVDARDVIDASLASLTDLAPRRCQVTLDGEVELHADPVLLERIVANLVANADRAAPQDTSLTVAVATVDDEWAELRVVDHGRGIPVAARERALAPFERLDPGSSRPGIGLGLAIADGFAAAMGGSLSLDDTPGGGLTVIVRLRRFPPESIPCPSRPLPRTPS